MKCGFRVVPWPIRRMKPSPVSNRLCCSASQSGLQGLGVNFRRIGWFLDGVRVDFTACGLLLHAFISICAALAPTLGSVET